MDKKIISLSLATIFALGAPSPVAYAKEEDNYTYVNEKIVNVKVRVTLALANQLAKIRPRNISNMAPRAMIFILL